MQDGSAFHDLAIEPWPAILLLGPTGAGKTPLGQILEEQGLYGWRCLHFDFGANLREVVDCSRPDDWIAASEIEFLRTVLDSGALLEDEHFPLAARVLQRFVARSVGQDTGLPDRSRLEACPTIVLNGLPRHVGQAEAMKETVRVQLVICLACSPDVVIERIRTNIGGDRTLRKDDDLDAVTRKLAVFQKRTAPLVAYFQQRGATLATIHVSAAMGAADMWRMLEQGQARSTD
jgi:adenylate kinase family enzyme